MSVNVSLMDGEKVGRWTVLNRDGAMWLCRCDCGTEKRVLKYSLTRGDTRSCGCLREELRKVRPTTHGKSRTPLYNLWTGIIQRCTNPNVAAYPDYGGRGIKVCDRWRTSFESFQTDLPDRPEDPPGWSSVRPYWTLDRIDNDGPYVPGNVRWASPSDQTRNRRPKVECKRKHALNDANTYVFPNGRRACRTCRRMHKRGEL